jgi:hypothetical protein
MGDELAVAVAFRAETDVARPILGLSIQTFRGEKILNANNYYQLAGSFDEPVREGTILCHLGKVPLLAGSYSISLWLCKEPHHQHHIPDALNFQVEEKDLWGTGRQPPAISPMWWPSEFQFVHASK